MNQYYALIISFNPNHAALERNTQRLRQQGFNLIVVDNASKNPPNNFLSEQETILLDNNLGMAAALNIGMEEAKNRGAGWVLSLDQDTEVPENILDEFIKNVDLPDAGALCPRIIRKNENERNVTIKDEYHAIDRCPTAGFFLRVDVWEKAGKYDDWMFIDYVDYDICMKIHLLGKKIYRINSTYIVQELGKLQVNSIVYRLGISLKSKKLQNFAHVYNHSPLRNYYFVRNSLYYIRKYEKYINVKAEMNHVVKWEVKKLFLEKNRLANLKAIRNGYHDYKIKIKELERMADVNENLRLNGEEHTKGLLNQIFVQAKKMQGNDWISLFLLGISFIPGKLWKLVNPYIWVVSEYKHLARDNGYWFYKYVRENCPNQKVYYPISNDSADREKIAPLGNIVRFSSFKHYMLFWAAQKQFTSSKNGGFPSRICEDLVQWNFHRFQYVMLNHGITKGKSTVVDASKTNYDYICTCSDLDRKIIIEDNGQPEDKVLSIGFARHDNLDNSMSEDNLILVMPTWRSWVNYKRGRNNKETEAIIKKFLESQYYIKYQELINDTRLLNYLECNNLKLVFYLHDYAQLYSDYYKSPSENIVIAHSENYDIQTLLKRASLLITDYSSVCYDFSYMYKPVLYYQFDKEEFEYYQYKAGELYSYEKNGVGEVLINLDELVSRVIDYHIKGFEMPVVFKDRVKVYFTHHDKNNCKRIYDRFR